MVINENVKRKVIPIASGKGGVGKTVIAVNLSLHLAKQGMDTVLVDLDLGGSNLHTVLGMKNTRMGIGNFLSDPRSTFDQLVHMTPYDNLRYVPGDVLVTGSSDLQLQQKKRIIEGILNLDADYIIIDLASGSSTQVLDFFLISNCGFIVTTPQTISVLNVYSFLKNLMVRFFQRAFADYNKVSEYLKKVGKEKRPGGHFSISEIINQIIDIDKKAGEKAKEYILTLHPKLIVNMASSPQDLEIVDNLRELINTTLALDIECMGMLYMDLNMEEALNRKKPLVVFDENSILSREVERIALKIVQSEKFPHMPLDLNYYKDSFELAQIEASTDYQEIRTLKSEELDVGELLAIISTQRKKIRELEGTVRMLTLKNPNIHF